jgi:hypothetical protein
VNAGGDRDTWVICWIRARAQPPSRGHSVPDSIFRRWKTAPPRGERCTRLNCRTTRGGCCCSVWGCGPCRDGSSSKKELRGAGALDEKGRTEVRPFFVQSHAQPLSSLGIGPALPLESLGSRAAGA